MASKWARLKGTIPNLPDDPSYAEAIRAHVEGFEANDLEQLAAAIVAFEEEKKETEAQLSEIALRLVAARRVLSAKLEAAGVESAVIGGHRWSPIYEPYPQVVDRAANLAWAKVHAPDNIALPYQTLKALTKAALDADEPLPDGLDVYLKPTLRRTVSR